MNQVVSFELSESLEKNRKSLQNEKYIFKRLLFLRFISLYTQWFGDGRKLFIVLLWS